MTKARNKATLKDIKDSNGLVRILMPLDEGQCKQYLKELNAPGTFTAGKLETLFKDVNELNAILRQSVGEGSRDANRLSGPLSLSVAKKQALIKELNAEGLIKIIKKPLKNSQIMSEAETLGNLLDGLSGQLQMFILRQMGGQFLKKIKTDLMLILTKVAIDSYDQFFQLIDTLFKNSASESPITALYSDPLTMAGLLSRIPVENYGKLFDKIGLAQNHKHFDINSLTLIAENLEPEQAYQFLSFINKVNQQKSLQTLIDRVTPWYRVLGIDSSAPNEAIYQAYLSHLSRVNPPGDFDLLAIKSNATQKTIRKAYQKLSLSLHPDKFKDHRLEAEEYFKSFVAAYQKLTGEVNPFKAANNPQSVVNNINTDTINNADDLFEKIHVLDDVACQSYLNQLDHARWFGISGYIANYILNNAIQLNQVLVKLNQEKQIILLNVIGTENLLEIIGSNIGMAKKLLEGEKLAIVLKGLNWDVQYHFLKMLENKLFDIIRDPYVFITILSKIPGRQYKWFVEEFEFLRKKRNMRFGDFTEVNLTVFAQDPRLFSALCMQVPADHYNDLFQLLSRHLINSAITADFLKMVLELIPADKYSNLLEQLVKCGTPMKEIAAFFPQARYKDFASFFSASGCHKDVIHYHISNLKVILHETREEDYASFLQNIKASIDLSMIASRFPQDRYHHFLTFMTLPAELAEIISMIPESQQQAAFDRMIELIGTDENKFRVVIGKLDETKRTELCNQLLKKILEFIIDSKPRDTWTYKLLPAIILSLPNKDIQAIIKNINSGSLEKAKIEAAQCEQKLDAARDKKAEAKNDAERDAATQAVTALMGQRKNQLIEHKSSGKDLTYYRIQTIVQNDLITLGKQKELFERHYPVLSRVISIIHSTRPIELAFDLLMQLLAHIPAKNYPMLIKQQEAKDTPKIEPVKLDEIITTQQQFITILEFLADKDDTSTLQQNLLADFSFEKVCQMKSNFQKRPDEENEKPLSMPEFIARLLKTLKTQQRQQVWERIGAANFQLIIEYERDLKIIIEAINDPVGANQFIDFFCQPTDANDVRAIKSGFNAAKLALNYHLELNQKYHDQDILLQSAEAVARSIEAIQPDLTSSDYIAAARLMYLVRKGLYDFTSQTIHTELAVVIDKLPGHSVLNYRVGGVVIAFLGALAICTSIAIAYATSGLLAPIAIILSSLVIGALAIYGGLTLEKSGRPKGLAFAAHRFLNTMVDTSKETRLVPVDSTHLRFNS